MIKMAFFDAKPYEIEAFENGTAMEKLYPLHGA